MQDLLSRADALFRRIRAVPIFYRFTLFTRILLAAGFIPTGLVKWLGRRFTSMPVETPMGAFFEAMFQTGAYWSFIGASQVLAGLLLLIPALAHLGAALFLPIILNIFVITLAISFKGTPFITGPMLLAVIYLCAWDYHRFRGLISTSPPQEPLTTPNLRLDRWEQLGFWIFGISLMTFFLWTRGFAPMALGPPSVILGAVGGLLALGRFAITRGRMHTEPVTV